MKKFLLNEDGLQFAEWGLLFLAVVAMGLAVTPTIVGMLNTFIGGLAGHLP